MNFLLLDWRKINLHLTRSTRTRHTATSKRFHTIRVDSLITPFVAFYHCFDYSLTILTRVWTMCPSRIWSTSTRMCVWLLSANIESRSTRYIQYVYKYSKMTIETLKGPQPTLFQSVSNLTEANMCESPGHDISSHWTLSLHWTLSKGVSLSVHWYECY